jgi:hypothetical protein
MAQYAGMEQSNKFVMGVQLKPARPLHGVPILIKNNIATMDKMNTTGVYPILFAMLYNG